MKTGTLVRGTLIADARFLGNCADLDTLISVYRSSLKTAVYDEGLEIYSFGEERVLDNWQGTETEPQVRQEFTLVVVKPISKNRIYQIVNQVQSQPLKFN